MKVRRHSGSSLAASFRMKHNEHELPLPDFAGINNQLSIIEQTQQVDPDWMNS